MLKFAHLQLATEDALLPMSGFASKVDLAPKVTDMINGLVIFFDKQFDLTLK